MKNLCLKRRDVNDPYEIWKSSNGDWTWKVLKKYQSDDNKPYAKWYCCVISPYCIDGEYGDVYVSDIKQCAVKVDHV